MQVANIQPSSFLTPNASTEGALTKTIEKQLLRTTVVNGKVRRVVNSVLAMQTWIVSG